VEFQEKYYFNLQTGEVEHGKKSGVFERMGPYDTHEEAAAALAAAQERTEAWDEEDKEWKEAWDGPEEGEEWQDDPVDDDGAEHPDA